MKWKKAKAGKREIMTMKKRKSVIELLAELDRINREIEMINSPGYIEKRTAEIFGDAPQRFAEELTKEVMKLFE